MARIARMTRIARIERSRDSLDTRVSRDSRELKNLNFGENSRRVNQSVACSSSQVIMMLRGEAEISTTMEDKITVALCGYLELYDTSYVYQN
ncbi:MAG: hypothetical protein ACRC6N_02810 [Plesiomonas sp.]|uniref:hypothetical protein n=1 Tax=Plesiomonas sp. TaxID=2486279 RepID=UPI003F3A3112